MANVYNSAPIKIDTVMAAGWRALQTLNTGSMPGYTAVRQPGITVTKVIWSAVTAANNTFTIVDPNDATLVLLAGKMDTSLRDAQYDFVNGKAFRDFKVSALDSGVLYIYYR